VISGRALQQALASAELGPCSGVPCSILGPLIRRLEASGSYTAAVDEGEAVGLAVGAALCGRTPVVLVQNSGLLNALNPLATLALVYDIPLLMLVSHRGEPGTGDAPQHAVTGRITLPLLDLLGIEHEQLAAAEEALQSQIRRVRDGLLASRVHALVARRGSIVDDDPGPPTVSDRPRRAEMLRLVVERAERRSILVAATGKIARETHAVVQAIWGDDGPALFPMAGSMGCAAAVGLGIAEQQPGQRVLVLDGDGAALMKLGSMATVACRRPPNLVHIVLDNEAYDSTGGQPAASRQVALEQLARAAGYASARRVETPQQCASALERLDGPGPHFVLAKVAPGADPDLPRLPRDLPALAAAFGRATGR